MTFAWNGICISVLVDLWPKLVKPYMRDWQYSGMILHVVSFCILTLSTNDMHDEYMVRFISPCHTAGPEMPWQGSSIVCQLSCSDLQIIAVPCKHKSIESYRITIYSRVNGTCAATVHIKTGLVWRPDHSNPRRNRKKKSGKKAIPFCFHLSDSICSRLVRLNN